LTIRSARRAGLRDDEMAENWALEPGMAVLGSDGAKAGIVKEVRRTDFLLARPLLRRDVYVPYSACAERKGDTVKLNVKAGEVVDQGWATPGEGIVS
jgi:hypothetical protein